MSNKIKVIVVDDIGSRAPEDFELSPEESVEGFKNKVAKRFNLRGEFSLITEDHTNLTAEDGEVQDYLSSGDKVSILPRGKSG